MPLKYWGIPVLLLLSGSTGIKSTYGNLPEKPNILFILTDDLGKEWISAYGGIWISAWGN